MWHAQICRNYMTAKCNEIMGKRVNRNIEHNIVVIYLYFYYSFALHFKPQRLIAICLKMVGLLSGFIVYLLQIIG